MQTDLLKRHPSLAFCIQPIQDSVSLLIKSFTAGNKLLTCGNGGSAADCEHIVGELMKVFLLSRPVPDEDARRFNGLQRMKTRT